MIDVHAHVVPSQLSFGMKGDPRWPVVEVEDDRGRVIIDGRVFRTIRAASWDLEKRVADMDREGVAVQVLSPMPELFSYWAEPVDAEAFCREMNAWIGAQARGGGGRFEGLGIVPLQDVDRAVAVLRDVRAEGLRGIEVGTNVLGTTIADERFRPVLAEAARLDLAVFVHSFHPSHLSEVVPAAASAVTFPLEIGFAVGALIANGVIEAVPDLRLGASHGGGAAPFTLSRLQHVWSQSDEMKERLPQAPLAYARRLFYDTLVFDPRALYFLVDRVGPSQIMVGSDYPFLGMPTGWTLRDAEDLATGVRASIATENARRFLALDRRHDG